MPLLLPVKDRQGNYVILGVVWGTTTGLFVAMLGRSGSTTGTVQAFNALSGTLSWSATVPVGLSSSSPAVAHGMVYVGGSSGLHAYHLP
jgi:outer membrane protein assembly factor BamB